jgi:hypothetical protein
MARRVAGEPDLELPGDEHGQREGAIDGLGAETKALLHSANVDRIPSRVISRSADRKIARRADDTGAAAS